MSSELQISERTEWTLGLGLWIQGLAMFGGKGSSKTADMVLMALQWCDIYGDKARVLILRRYERELEGIITMFTMFLMTIYYQGSGDKERTRTANLVRKMFNGSDKQFRFPNGGFVQLGGMEREADHLRYRGRNWNFLGVDEYPQYEGPKLINLVRAELRGAPGIKPRICFTGNPGLKGHDQVNRNFIKGKKPYVPWTEPETGLTWITIPSNARENPFLDADEHMKQIAAIAQNDPDLARALQTGDFNAIRGGEFFGDAWNERGSLIWNWDMIPDSPNWRVFLSLDHGGGSAPTVAMFCALAWDGAIGPNGDFFPRGSLVLFDEVHDAVEGDWDETLGWSIARNCDQIKERCSDYDMKARGLVDPQVDQDHGAETLLHDEYTSNKVHLQPWRKHRRSHGSALLRELMHGAAHQDHRKKPGLYVTPRCKGFLGTVPFMERDKADRSVPVDGGADHWFDATRGAVHHHRDRFSVGTLN